MLITICAVVMFSGLTAGTASAAAAWYTVDIKEVGQAGNADSVLIRLAGDTGFATNGTWCKIVNQVDRSTAVVLTAFSLSKRVKVNVDLNDGQSFHIINNIYLQQ